MHRGHKSDAKYEMSNFSISGCKDLIRYDALSAKGYNKIERIFKVLRGDRCPFMTMITRQLLGKGIDQEDKKHFSNRTPPSLALGKNVLQNSVMLQVNVFYH